MILAENVQFQKLIDKKYLEQSQEFFIIKSFIKYEFYFRNEVNEIFNFVCKYDLHVDTWS